jgi:serine/threonine-protein kinase
VDGRSDLFSLTSVLYRALTGRPAFPGSGTPRIMFDVVYSMPEQPSRQSKGLSRDMDLVIATGLAKDRERRFQSASDLIAALHAAVGGNLDEAHRTAGRALLLERPWGSRPAGAPSSG